MKIQKIVFQTHPLFPSGHEIIFEAGGIIPQISYLVGNNGSGKTKVLEAIYLLLNTGFTFGYDLQVLFYLELKPEEHSQSDHNEIFIVSYTKKGGNYNTSVQDIKGGKSKIDIKSLSKIIYSTVEVNFLNQDIKTVTAMNIDEDNPKAISKNLHSEIPQLLIDIKSLDDTEIAEWFTDTKNAGKTINDMPNTIGSKFKRFQKAFHKIYNNTKKFKGIINSGDKKLIVFTDITGNEIDIGKFSSGEQQVLYRVGYILKNLNTINGGLVLIDEPEISLHPVRQERFRELLLETFSSDVQIIMTTHSPYIFRKIDDTSGNEACIKIDTTQTVSSKVNITFPGLTYTPSPNYISYVAYGIYSNELHIELYTQLLIKYNKNGPTKLDNFLKDTTNINEPVKQTFTRIKNSTMVTENETIMTWIRNKIHHPDETVRPDFLDTDLKDSIDRMIEILAL